MNRFFAFLRTLLVLGRVSNLPTVWSNCLAAWWLGGAGNTGKLPFVLGGGTCIYIGGMFLNDAFDAGFDREHRNERPIPSGRIAENVVWRWGLGWLAVGGLLLLTCSKVTGGLGLILILCVLVYDALHKQVSFAPVLMALCRFFLYIVAASAALSGVTGWAIWAGVALGLYIVGLSYLARRESDGGFFSYWPMLCLVAPFVLAYFMNAPDERQRAFLVALLLLIWSIRSLRYTLWSIDQNIGRTVSGLLAGIVFVDWLAVADGPRNLSFGFVVLFGAALLLQRFVPAT